MCIAKTKEFVYYHPLKACLPKEIAMMTFWCQRTLQADFKLAIGRYFGGSLDSLWELCGSRIPDDVYPLFYEELFNRYE